MSHLRAASYPDGTPPYVPRGLTAPVNQYERFRQTGRFGDLWAPQLSAILYKLDQGYLDDWADLVEFALSTDGDLFSLYETRITRVTQATFEVVPNEHGDERLAKLAAEFVNEQVARIPRFNEVKRHLLHGNFVGIAFAEMEWDHDANGVNYVRMLHPRHTHRFRYDERWVPRLYDFGQRKSTVFNPYGEALDPRRWIVHRHQAIAGYPNVAGIMRPAIWTWLFSKWMNTWALQTAEKYGMPFTWAEVPVNTPQATRDQILSDLENLTASHVAVVETGGTLRFETTTMATTGQTLQTTMLDRYQATLSKLILGASDVVDQGDHGSQAAVNTRAGIATDPRMVNDGIALGESFQASLFYWLLALNLGKFGGVMPPVPQYVAKTASDEVKTDVQDLAEQTADSAPLKSGQMGRDPAVVNQTGAEPDAEAILSSVAAEVDRGAIEMTEAAARVCRVFGCADATSRSWIEAFRGSR